jgi:protoporphyrinogen oxidase
LGTYQGGFQAFADDFANHLEKLGVAFKFGIPINKIEPTSGGGFRIFDREGQSREIFDKVLNTTSPKLMAQLAPNLPTDYLDGLLSLKSMGAVVMTLSLKHQVSEEGFYWFNIPKDAGFPFLAVVEHTNYIPRENFGGDHILYCGDYLEPDHEYFDLSDEELLGHFIPGIQRINPGFGGDWVNKVWVHRTKYAQPVPLVEHSKNIPPIKTPVEGLYFASMSQVYPWDRGTNFAVEIGRRAAGLMMNKG